ncbi:ribulose-phosphate 3-epimerase [Williamsoniiplasma somnilux]|uniref:Ribulose-phosphate 3-epimerase n=1 Tax=Williamsoniiplasma somnilux TaxID=215578 RepID=A0A2K8P0R9_9MOLU|nr:ribulose-phosphate 3-epimerase [Williamsoniiplasma somnilux]ATZ18601.1 ribulose-phosphate 3-epimerase [Williamsoniiplasma somnilux]
MKKFIIAPSVLSANYMNLKNDLTQCLENDINWIHYDVMDYDFVPNLTFGSKILQDITSQIKMNIDIHFMVKVKTKNFTDFFVEYIKANPQMMTMHIESMNAKETKLFIDLCKKNNIKASLAVSPQTPIKKIIKYLPIIDNILVMTVEPGFGGQSFIEHAAGKIGLLRKIIDQNNYKTTIEVDGGINSETSKIVKDYGVDIIVAGSYLFGQKDFAQRAKKLAGGN